MSRISPDSRARAQQEEAQCEAIATFDYIIERHRRAGSDARADYWACVRALFKDEATQTLQRLSR